MHSSRFAKFLFAAALCLPLAAPLTLCAQSAAAPTASASPSAAPVRNTPFRGTITSSDAAAQTFTIKGKLTTRVFKVTSQTKLLKRAGGAATFADLKAGEYVTGTEKKLGPGQYEAESVKVGPKSAAASPSPSASRRSARNPTTSASPAASPSAAAR